MRALFVLPLALTGCYATIEPGHRGLLFNPHHGGLQKDVLGPGRHKVGYWGRVDDFDVTYSTHKEEQRTKSIEGTNIDVKLSIRYRPVVQELYELDTEIGPNYYDEVIGPEFRTAIRGTFARHSYLEVQKMNEKIEDEIEAEVRRRIAGSHVEITSVTLENLEFPPEIDASIQAKQLGEQEAARKMRQQEAEQARLKEAQAFREDMMKREQNETKAKALLENERELTEKEHEKAMAEAQAQIEKEKVEAEAQIEKVKVEADSLAKVAKAKADAQAMSLMAKAHADERRAESSTLTPLQVMMHGYDALAKLGGENTAFIFGDWSKVPSFLFPQTPAFRALFPGAGAAPSNGPLARNAH